ncbi:MAG TPA: hypothetical protein VLY03_07610 [Bacteroidota bacterium]|nr:hypothetical protein [Bacteroidota bacterium]
MISLLKEYSHKMRGRDLDEFEMMRKRDVDDEDLDEMTRRRLTALYVQYVPERYRT